MSNRIRYQRPELPQLYRCCLLLLSQVILAVGSDSTWKSERLRLPRIYEYDDFDECREGNPNFQYCVLRANILPDSSSSIWRNISAISADRRNFPHTQHERGLCLRGCLWQLLADGNVTSEEVDRLEAATQIMNSAVRKIHTEYLARCVNRELQQSHGLHTTSSVEHCLSKEDFDRYFDFAEILFIVLAIGLVLLIGVATVLSSQKYSSRYYDLIQPFSALQNIKQLLNGDRRSGRSLRYLEGLRAIFMLTVLVGHSVLPIIRIPLKNTEDLELQTNSFIFPLINSGNTHMIASFFALGGMVQAVSFLATMDRAPSGTSPGFAFLWSKLLHRLARLVPAYSFIIFYEATLFRRTKLTPVAYKFVDYCDTHWWSNLLFINNYVHLDEPCLKFGWYLGADFQLFLVGLTLLILARKFPLLRKTYIAIMVLVAFAVPGYVIYKERLVATMEFNMSHALTELRTYKEFLVFYTPASTNAGPYFFGIIAGMLYHNLSHRKDLQSSVKRLISIVFPIVLLLFLALNGFLTILPSFAIDKPSLLLAIYGSALKAIWGIAFAMLFLLLSFRTNTMVVAALEHPVLMVLAKLSYTLYIVQYSIIYTVYSNIDVPMIVNISNTLLIEASIILMTLVAGTLLHVAIEVPCATILKRVINEKFFIPHDDTDRQMALVSENKPYHNDSPSSESMP